MSLPRRSPSKRLLSQSSQPEPPQSPTKKSKRQSQKADPAQTAAATSLLKGTATELIPASIPVPLSSSNSNVLPVEPPFDFQLAKKHLIQADSRFEQLFRDWPCKAFDGPAASEDVDPFRSLVSSLLGQQISWLAARSIKHKFIRSFFPEMPEKYDQEEAHTYAHLFPTPAQVLARTTEQLRACGLSGAKANYVHDLAARFQSGELSMKLLTEGTDEEVYDALIAVKGIGPWTVQMFSIFTLRRPNILPCGDLGVQKGMVKFFLSEAPVPAEDAPAEDAPASATPIDLLSFSPSTPKRSKSMSQFPLTPTISSSTVLISETASVLKTTTTLMLPPPTPPRELPKSMSVPLLKSRLGGKKAAKNAYLTPEEMDDLTREWAPYRSVGVYFMWRVAETDGQKKKKDSQVSVDETQ